MLLLYVRMLNAKVYIDNFALFAYRNADTADGLKDARRVQEQYRLA